MHSDTRSPSQASPPRMASPEDLHAHPCMALPESFSHRALRIFLLTYNARIEVSCGIRCSSHRVRGSESLAPPFSDTSLVPVVGFA